MCIYIYICIYTYVCIYIYIYMYCYYYHWTGFPHPHRPDPRRALLPLEAASNNRTNLIINYNIV